MQLLSSKVAFYENNIYICIRMETIFDHNVTPEEERELNGSISREDYLRFVSQKGAYVDIAHLYWHRGKKWKARRYIKKTKDCNLINSFWRTVNHP